MAPKPKGWEEYRERNRLLKAMGFDTYRDYLDSDLWRRIRSVIMANQPECGLCQSVQAQVVHHLNYCQEVLEGEDLGPLMPLCFACHEAVEFTSDKQKRNPHQARAYLYRRGVLVKELVDVKIEKTTTNIEYQLSKIKTCAQIVAVIVPYLAPTGKNLKKLMNLIANKQLDILLDWCQELTSNSTSC